MSDYDGFDDFDPEDLEGDGDSEQRRSFELDNDIGDRELEVYHALGVLDLQQLVITPEDANQRFMRASRFINMGDAIRYVIDTAALPFTRFVYYAATDEWGVEIGNSDQIVF